MTDIDNISTFLWSNIKKKIHNNNIFNIDFPLITYNKKNL